MINIGVVTSSIPNTGMQLPFFSYGGTSLIILLCAVRSLAEYFKANEKNIGFRKEDLYMRAIIACAGTGGHINPGIAIANKIKEAEKSSEILFIGTERGLETDLVPRAGYSLKTIEAYGLSKKISFDNLKKMLKTIRGLSQAKKIIKDFKPDVVIRYWWIYLRCSNYCCF